MTASKKAWIPVVSILALLYYLSSIPGLRVLPVLRQTNKLLQSFDLSISRLAVALANRLPAQLDPARTISADFFAYARRNPVIIEFLLRKAAHIFFFFVITIVFFLLLRHYLQKPWQVIMVSFIGGTIMAFLDEYHQSLVSGRHGNFIDVGIDMIGVTTAIALLIFSFWLTAKHRTTFRKNA
ncbi:MAG: VanZ family protein [Bacillota bacterium]|nr:VanZ family protein [Bacillota bacterium]MDW7684138.1 VanZ family protein [Bacillota bacterium]